MNMRRWGASLDATATTRVLLATVVGLASSGLKVIAWGSKSTPEAQTIVSEQGEGADEFRAEGTSEWCIGVPCTIRFHRGARHFVTDIRHLQIGAQRQW